MSRKELAELRKEVIEKRKEILKKKVSALERKLYESIFDKLLSELERSEGMIVSNGKNMQLSATLDKIFNEFSKSEGLGLIKTFAKDLQQIQTLNERYFATIEEDNEKIRKITRDVDSVMRKRIGLNTKGEVVKNGYLDRLIKDPVLSTKVKEATLKAVTAGRPITDLRTEIKTLIVGNDKIDGGLQKHFNQFIYDTYEQFDRTTSKLYAVKLDLRVFIYAGGKIKTSRCFCIKNNGKVFTTDEAEEWKKLANKECGPVVPKGASYDPLVDMGGPGCRHTPDFISNTLAIQLRPELAEVLG